MSLITSLNLPAGLSNYGEYMQNSPSYRRKVIWVGNATGLPAGSGKRPDAPMSSLVGTGGALAAAAASAQGTRIYLLPGTAFNIDAADWASATGTNANIEIIGLGQGQNRPTFTSTTATSTWLIDTANITIANCIFRAAGPVGSVALTVANLFTVSATGFNLIGNYIQTGIDADQLCTDTILTTSGATYMTIAGNVVNGALLSESTSFLTTTGATNYLRITDNEIAMAIVTAATGVIFDLSNAAIVDNAILRNLIYNREASSVYVIKPHATSTGFVHQNIWATGDGGTAPAVSAWTTFTTTYRFGINQCITADGKSALLCPGVDA